RPDLTDLDVDPGRPQPLETAPGDPRIGIAVAGHDLGDPRRDHRVSARRRAAVVRAGLQGHIERRAARPLSGVAERLDLGMRTADLAMPAAADDLVPLHENGTDHRIGRSAVAPAGGQPESQAERFSRGGQWRTPAAGSPPGRRPSRRLPGRAPAGAAPWRWPPPCRPWPCRRAWRAARRRSAPPG